MIKASKALVDFIEAQGSIPELAERLDVTRQTVYNIKNGVDVSSDMVAKILNLTGFDFEKAFEVEESK